jgi:S-adenosylmethionine:tRNA ribosyltransferase-isomerase
MTYLENINIEDFNYDLPSEKIAQYPLEKRDHSKLLIYKNSDIFQDIFNNINNYLPPESLLIFNDTKVIHARIIFKKETGIPIELFCLEPFNKELQIAFQQQENCKWKCLVGNNKKWKSGILKIENEKATLYAEKIMQDNGNFIIRFSWEPGYLIFSEILEVFGKVPLPPYIGRNAEKNDEDRYQTIFAKHDGSVAAPTAGLHFTEKVFHELAESGIKIQFLTLHVGTGTFKPVTDHNISNHEMHEEHFSVSRQLIQSIIKQGNFPIFPVGTTSLRTIESIYWLGVKQILKKENMLFLDQWESYELDENLHTGQAGKITVKDALSVLLYRMDDLAVSQLNASTKMIIIPGYDFKIANGIITNFHQPRSTLLLLVAAMIGEKWKETYKYALENNFRFLSYGDCCLFVK